MANGIRRDRNYNDAATITPPIALSSTVSTKIADANEDRMFFYVTNNSAVNSVWIKLQGAGVDNDKKGIFLPKANTPGGSGIWQMPVDTIYTGEICAIAEGDSPDVYVTEF